MMFIQINRMARITLLLVIIGFSSPPLYATDDPTDNQAAQSQNAEELKESTNNTSDDTETGKWGKFLALPIFVTEPAIGQGLGATLIYFHREDDEQKTKFTTGQEISKSSEPSKPPRSQLESSPSTPTMIRPQWVLVTVTPLPTTGSACGRRL
jgi:hypothetical protein